MWKYEEFDADKFIKYRLHGKGYRKTLLEKIEHFHELDYNTERYLIALKYLLWNEDVKRRESEKLITSFKDGKLLKSEIVDKLRKLADEIEKISDDDNIYVSHVILPNLPLFTYQKTDQYFDGIELNLTLA